VRFRPAGFLLFLTFAALVFAAPALADDIAIVSPLGNALVSGKVKVVSRGKPPNSTRVSFYVDGHEFATAPARKHLARKWDSGTVAAGLHSLSAIAFDSADQVTGSSQENVFVGTGVVISSPANDATVSGSFNVICQVASGARSAILYIDGTKRAEGPPYVFALSAETIGNGSHTITVEAIGRNHTSMGSASIRVNVTQPAPTPTSAPTSKATRTPIAISTASPLPHPPPSLTQTPVPGAHAYYVDPSGSDAAAGTSPSTAWRTLSRVNSASLVPGDVVYLKRGGFWREALIPSASGTSGAPIVFTAFGTGNLPIISGADAVKTWTNYAGAIFRAALGTSPANVYVDRASGWGLLHAGSPSAMPAGSWYWSNGFLYVRLSDGSDLNTHFIEAAVRREGVYATNRSYITIDHLAVERTAGWGIELMSESNQSQTTGVIVSNNLVTQNGTGEVDTGGYFNAIYINRAVSPVVEGNTVSYAGGHNGINVQYATNGKILDNNVRHFNHSGIDVKWCDRMLIAGNAVHDSRHVSIYSQSSSNITIEDNIVFNITGTACGSADGIHVERMAGGQNVIFNNSIYNAYCGIYLLSPAAVMNNALNAIGSGYGLRAVSGGTYDYNDLGQNAWVELDSKQYRFSAWRALGGHSHDIAADPMWTAPATGDMSLRSGSPCIHAGTDVGLPYAGPAPDMGAVDSQ